MLASSSIHAIPTVTFQGEITEQTCEATINNQVNPIVVLPTVSAKALSSAGSSAGLTPITIKIENCQVSANDDLKVNAQFLGRSVTSAGNLGNLATVNAAKNVALQLTSDSKGTSPLLLNGMTGLSGLVVKKGESSAVYDFGVQYISEEGSAKAGQITGIVEYSLSYL